MKSSLLERQLTPKEILDDIYCSLGDVVGAESLDKLPRGPQDLYNARYDAKRKRESLARDEIVKKGSTIADDIWIMLERAKREEQDSKGSIFIRECKIHPDLFLVLANDRQLKDLVTFCTNPREFSVFAIDPTFNVIDTNLSLTVTTYRNLKLRCKKTNKSPVFIGPIMLHQNKIWKTYSNFANTLITEQPELEGILACGTDGERGLINGLKRNFRIAVFQRCFLHVKDNLKRELGKRSFNSTDVKVIIEEIFGKQVEHVKYYGLVDCDTEEEFDRKLDKLKAVWNQRENCKSGNSFYEWFKKEKVRTFGTVMRQSFDKGRKYSSQSLLYKNVFAPEIDIAGYHRNNLTLNWH